MAELTLLNLTVLIDGRPRLVISSKLLDKQQAWDRLDDIKALHVERLELEQFMEVESDPFILKQYNKLYTDIEFRLQDAWGFPRDANYHRFWRRPKCLCPQYDNDDSYGTGYSYITASCPLHGRGI
jgi:hypothetical protein